MNSRGKENHAITVSFSGIDGAGKSTQIQLLRECLEDAGLKVAIVRFWDDIARLKPLRESTGHTLFKGDKGVGTPEAPITRRDKNVQSWMMTCIRLFLYFIDALSTRSAVNKVSRIDADFVIFDRYCYDEFANLNLSNRLLRRYVLLLLKLVPVLGRSYLLDADPVQARARKPEYPLDFLYQNRAAYLEMCSLTARMTVISTGSVEEVKDEIRGYTLCDLKASFDPSSSSGFSAKRPTEPETLDEPHTRPAS